MTEASGVFFDFSVVLPKIVENVRLFEDCEENEAFFSESAIRLIIVGTGMQYCACCISEVHALSLQSVILFGSHPNVKNCAWRKISGCCNKLMIAMGTWVAANPASQPPSLDLLGVRCNSIFTSSSSPPTNERQMQRIFPQNHHLPLCAVHDIVVE